MRIKFENLNVTVTGNKYLVTAQLTDYQSTQFYYISLLLKTIKITCYYPYKKIFSLFVFKYCR